MRRVIYKIGKQSDNDFSGWSQYAEECDLEISFKDFAFATIYVLLLFQLDLDFGFLGHHQEFDIN